MFNRIEEKIIDKEICNLLELKVIQEVNNSDDQYLSPIFTVPKKDGEHRMILNLKDLNQNIEYYHFKMDTFETALKLIKPNCFMASIDVRHAYYSVLLLMKIENVCALNGKMQFFNIPAFLMV
jgi:hypothetical protein